ncbi:hypothetical protein AVEN_185748-1 [Araneus ventricosus]|uniref:Uncharacterized protein n=1 Tax=Araneus ventricosus TaxID=182803 RepID=A0A4Y2PKZ1_ARAVE|nr:hypothetical protein AVEN_185748-1 [Araneus ventricosus]
MDAEIGTTCHWIWMSGSKSAEEPHKGWSGFMDIVAGKRCYDKSAVIPFPFVNLQPSDPISINTCLHVSAEECRKLQQRCIVTFKLPLFIKAIDIVSQADEIDELSKVIVRLGGFHLLMSYMGAVAKSWVAVASQKCDMRYLLRTLLSTWLMDILMQEHYQLIRFLKQQLLI